MSNQAKFLISLLFIAVIILCAGLTQFYFDVTKNTGDIDDQDTIVSILKKYDSGFQVFKSTNGYYGLLDRDGAVIIEPEWMEILTVTDRMALVSRRMQDDVLIGGIDFEENVILPFMFHSMEAIADNYYIGTVAQDESCVIYNSAFEPMFQSSWQKAEYENGMLYLEKNACRFSYYIGGEEPIFRKAQMSCAIGKKQLNWNISNRIYLSDLTPDDLLRINTCVTTYIDMLLGNDFSNLYMVSTEEYSSGLRKLDAFSGFEFKKIRDFSFSSPSREEKLYDFAFTIEYHKEPAPESETEMMETQTIEEGEIEESVQVNLLFKRNASNQFILSSVALDYHSVQIPS